MTNEVTKNQLDAIKDWPKIVIDYGPEWAIETGNVATLTQAQVFYINIRVWLKDNISDVKIIELVGLVNGKTVVI